MKKRSSEEQIINVSKEQDAGISVKEIIRRHSIVQQIFYRKDSKFGGMEVSNAKRLRELEPENAKLKKLVAEKMLDNAALKDVVSQSGVAIREAVCCISHGGGA